MTGYTVAWLVLGVSALAVAALVFVAMPRWGRLRYLAAAVVLVWSLTPFQFDGEHWAPAFAVAIFRLFLEDGADPRPSLYLLGSLTAILLAVHLVVGMVVAALKKRRGGRLDSP
ncbi:MAG: hypothetical protein F4X98_06005 [Gammaproteobacteria bacterium]|nr:hypothetical protein [Gammaproteobacteria bacterium]